MDGLTGIVVGQNDLGDHDRIVRFLTVEEGRIDFVARGARRSKKRFAGVLELGNRVRVIPHRSRGDLASIAEAELLSAVKRARTDLDRIAYLAYGCELVSRLAGRNLRAPKLTRLLAVWLELLELPDDVPSAARLALESKALTFAGMLPSLTDCSQCGESLDEPATFSFEAGIRHARCGEGRAVEPSWLVAVEGLRRTPLFECGGMQDPGGWLLADWVQHHSQKELQSRALLAELLTL